MKTHTEKKKMFYKYTHCLRQNSKSTKKCTILASKTVSCLIVKKIMKSMSFFYTLTTKI